MKAIGRPHPGASAEPSFSDFSKGLAAWLATNGANGCCYSVGGFDRHRLNVCTRVCLPGRAVKADGQTVRVGGVRLADGGNKQLPA